MSKNSWQKTISEWKEEVGLFNIIFTVVLVVAVTGFFVLPVLVLYQL